MIPKTVAVFVGMTSKEMLSKKVGAKNMIEKYLHKSISGQEVFIHPKLSTTRVIQFRKIDPLFNQTLL